MPHIQTLSPHVADLIAAGEVVERPASVIKELLENAIDAGARAVTVEIEHGGMILMRVTDDGCGIAPEDVATAFLRHATSKIRTEHDLEAIGTLGFRGEALAAVAAVSRVEIITRPADSELGTALVIEGGVVLEQEATGCPAGTTMVVRNLFYNTPARLKFVKKDAAEGAAVFAVVQRVALSHPELSVKFIRDGKQDLLTPGDGKLESAVYSVLGRDMALGLTPVKGSGEGIAVSGFVSVPTCCRGTRGFQYFFVSGRQVKSPVMMAALEQAYQNQRMVGKFPACVLHMEVKPAFVDVNVHPTKIEVKFAHDRQVFDAVYHTVLSALGGETRRPAVTFSAPVSPVERGTAVLRDGAAVPPIAPSVRPAYPPVPARAVPPQMPAVERTAPVLSAPETMPQVAPQAKQEVMSAEFSEVPWRVAGEAFDTYIIVEQGDALTLIDKHAAHERLEFDKRKAEGYAPMPQQLLTPIAVTLAPEEGAALLRNLPLLAEYGFEAEDFGGGAILVRQAPADIATGQLEGTLVEIAAQLIGGQADPAAARDALLRTIACKAAIKGGQKNAPAELQRVAELVMSGQVKYCPHGRPVAIQLTRGQLEKQFKRA